MCCHHLTKIYTIFLSVVLGQKISSDCDKRIAKRAVQNFRKINRCSKCKVNEKECLLDIDRPRDERSYLSEQRNFYSSAFKWECEIDSLSKIRYKSKWELYKKIFSLVYSV